MTKLMIVEDNPRARRALKALMAQQAGIHVSAEASNGQEAINIIKKQSPDVVLMDMQMPVMDGLEATRIVKSKWPQIRIVILTIHAGCQPEALSAGADAFLVKGCPLDELMASFQNSLQPS